MALFSFLQCIYYYYSTVVFNYICTFSSLSRAEKKDLKVDLDRGKMPILMIFLDFCNLTYTLLLSRVRFLKHFVCTLFTCCS